MFPDSGFFLKRSDVFMHTHDSKVRYIINVTLPKWLHSSPGWYSERGGLCSHQEGASPTSPSWFWTSTSSIPTRQLASPSSMTRRLTTVWWREVLHHLRPCGHQHSTTCAPFPSNHHIVIVSQCLMISWEKLFIDKIIRPKSNESMWYFRPLELLEGFFSSVFKLVVLEFISWKASLLNDEHVCRETTSSWARVVALLAAERLFSQMG